MRAGAFRLELGGFGGRRPERFIALADQRALAHRVLLDLREPLAEFVEARGGALRLVVELLGQDGKSLQGSSGCRFGVP